MTRYANSAVHITFVFVLLYNKPIFASCILRDLDYTLFPLLTTSYRFETFVAVKARVFMTWPCHIPPSSRSHWQIGNPFQSLPAPLSLETLFPRSAQTKKTISTWLYLPLETAWTVFLSSTWMGLYPIAFWHDFCILKYSSKAFRPRWHQMQGISIEATVADYCTNLVLLLGSQFTLANRTQTQTFLLYRLLENGLHFPS